MTFDEWWKSDEALEVRRCHAKKEGAAGPQGHVCVDWQAVDAEKLVRQHMYELIQLAFESGHRAGRMECGHAPTELPPLDSKGKTP